MSSREKILSRLQLSARNVEPPPPWRASHQTTDLVGRFATALGVARGEVILAGSEAEALVRLVELLRQLGLRRVVANAEPPLQDIAARFPGVQWHIVGETAGDLRAFCAAADAGVSGADAALADTGTVVVSSGPGRSRAATLLPPVHIVLLPASKITQDLISWTQARGGAWPSSVTLISGPSKSADIEQTLTVGVHGPVRFIVIVYGEEFTAENAESVEKI